MAAVSLRNIQKQFGDVRTLHGIDLDIGDGEFTVFVGPSGCGKSTLLRTIAGLEDISGGELLIDGVQVNELPPAKRGINMVFQSYALYPHMTVFDNMAFGLKLAGMSKAEYTEPVARVAKVLQLEHLLERKPAALSGGQRQRVAIGRAIVQKPKVFLFDEPLSNLDAALRVQMRIEIGRLHRELGVTMIYVTHDQVEAMTLADRIVVLSAGRIEQVGPPVELYHEPRNLFVAGFLGSPAMNLIAGKVISCDSTHATIEQADGKQLSAAVDASSAKPGDQVTLGVRPEHIKLGLNTNMLTVEAVAVEHLGEASILYARPHDGSDAVVSARLPALTKIGIAEQCQLGFDAKHAHLFNQDGQAFRRLYPLAE